MKETNTPFTECAICGRNIELPASAEQAELSNSDNKYYSHGIPPGHVSQGWFYIGADCFRTKVVHNHTGANLKVKISELACVVRCYTFNDGSKVTWRPADLTGKAHGLFNVSINIKDETGGSISTEQHEGPPSEHASLHHLKKALKALRG